MISSTPTETVMTALLAALVSATTTTFNADTRIGSNELLNINNQVGSPFLGLPVFGAGIPPLSLLTGTTPATLSQAATANQSQQSPLRDRRVVTSGRRRDPLDRVRRAARRCSCEDPDEDNDWQQQMQVVADPRRGLGVQQSWAQSECGARHWP